MDYTDILNSINYQLSQILEILNDLHIEEWFMTLTMIFVIFLLLYIMRGE